MKQIPRHVTVFSRKDISEKRYFTYGETHGFDPFTGIMREPIPAGKNEDDISQVLSYNPGEQIKAEVWPKVYKGNTFEFEGKTWLVLEATNTYGRVDIPTSVVAVYRPPIETT